MSLASEANEKFNESVTNLEEQFVNEFIISEKGTFDHGVATQEFGDLNAKKMASLLAKEQGNYKDAMASLQYFENRWGKKASNADLAKIEATRDALRKLYKRDANGEKK